MGYLLLGALCLTLCHLWLRARTKFLNLYRHYYPLVTLPDKAHITCGVLLDRLCRRCNLGKIKYRKRYTVSETEKGELVPKSTIGVYSCTSCSYRGLELKDIL